MIFVRAGNYFMESKCQHYTVSKVMTDRINYMAWRGKEFLGVKDTPEEAQGLCESEEKRLQFKARTEASIAKYEEAHRA